MVFATKNSLSEWSITFPPGARDIRIEKVALAGATHGKDELVDTGRDDPAAGRDVQLPRYGVFTGYWPARPRANNALPAAGGVNDGAPGQTYQEFLAFQVLFVAEECVAPLDDGVGSSSGGSGAPTTPVRDSGALPTIAPSEGVLQTGDGTVVPLAVSSPRPGEVRYASDGVTAAFRAATGTSVSNGLVVAPDGEILCEVCYDTLVDQVIEVWMFSEPRLVAAHRTDEDQCQTFVIPLGDPLDGGGPVSAGAQTLQLALPTASGMQAVNVGVTVGGPVPASVPAGEGAVPTPAWLLALAMLASVGAALAVRRQVVAD